MVGTVAAILVSHDGARWLPAVLDGLAAQTRQPDRLIGVDTGSKDTSAHLVSAALRRERGDVLIAASGDTSYPEAVRGGLDAAGDAEWIWLLHDDSRPESTALELLLAAAAAHPQADAFGPKLREWPSLRRLLEVGITISGTGARETGLERGEYDQGQHDQVRAVLAVNTAGMLVRRSLLERLGGFDPELPVYGNDLDFGWRAAAAGHTILVIPQAVVFHAEAAHRGLRRTHLTGKHPHYAERRAALFTLLANCRRGALPLLWVRLLLGTLVRVTGLVLTRRVGQGLDELAALLSLYLRPGEIRRGRRVRRALRTSRPSADRAHLRRLLAPWWLPYRHGLDAITDALTALTHQAQDVAERRRSARIQAEGGARSARSEDDPYAEEPSTLSRWLLNPVALAVGAFVVLALIGARDAFGSVVGGGLAPAPEQWRDWWTLHVQDRHLLGLGSSLPAPAYLVVLMLLAAVLGGSPGAAISALMLAAVPVALWGAWRFLRVVGHLLDPRGAPRWVLAWGAACYALLPVASGAWGQGRFGTVATAAVLPWLAHAALGFLDPSPERRWRAAWRVALLLAVATAFGPLIWLLAVLVVVLMLILARLLARGGGRDFWRPPVVAVLAVPVLLLPWWLPLVWRGAAAGLLIEAGGPPGARTERAGLLVGRLAETGAPWWAGAALAVLAVIALIPSRTRTPVLVCWLVAAIAAVPAAVLAPLRLELPTGPEPVGLSVLGLVISASFVVAVVLAAQGVSGRIPDPGPALARAVVLPLVLVAALIPVVGMGWFLVGENALGDAPPPTVPEYMVQEARASSADGILVLTGSVSDGLEYTIRRDAGGTLGEREILALTPQDEAFTTTLRELVSSPSPEAVETLAAHGVEYLLLPRPAEGRVAAVLDATDGLVHASAEERGTRAWQVAASTQRFSGLAGTSWWRWLLVAAQALAVLVAAVLAGPSRAEEQR